MSEPDVSQLDRRLRAWARQWSSEPGAALAADQLLVNERVRRALGSLFGAGAVSRVESTCCPQEAGHASLLMPVALPLFDAFLGRRAARELSRKMLSGL